MDDVKKILSDEIFEWYPSQYPFKSFVNTVYNTLDIHGVISVAGLFLPEFVEYKNFIFYKENVQNKIDAGTLLPCPFGKDKKTTEKYYNLMNLDDFFAIKDVSEIENNVGNDDIRLLNKLGKLLEYFWSRRLKELFQEKIFKFELAEDLYDEDGLCLTFWQEK